MSFIQAESTPQKRGKVNPEESDDGKIEYKIQRRSPSLLNDSSPNPAKKDEEISAERPFGAEKTSMNFPEKIMRILSFSEFAHVIRWNADGTEFCIFPQSFSETVLEPHFQGTKFQSFTRKLNRFGFKRILDEDRYPKGTFAYHHDCFQRGREDLLRFIEIDSEKKQRKLAIPGAVPVVGALTGREASMDQSRTSRLDNFASQLSNISSSPTSLPTGYGGASSLSYLPSQQEMNRLQGIRLRQQQMANSAGRNNPSLQSSLPSSLYMQSAQPSVSNTAFLQDLSYHRQDQLTRALQQLPGQQQGQQHGIDPRTQQPIDPRVLYLLLRQQQQRQGRSPSGPL
jgi:hypothetical protein